MRLIISVREVVLPSNKIKEITRMIKDNIFNEGMLSAIQNTARSHMYHPLSRVDETSIFVLNVQTSSRED